MAWIRSEQSLVGHPKTKRAARALGVPVPMMVGHLHCLWYWALDYAGDGSLEGFEAWEIAEAAGYEGEPEQFIAALVNCGNDGAGFLEESGDMLVIHDWYDYAGRYIEQREANAERMRKKRAEDVQRTCSARTGATKRREEESTNEEDEERTRPSIVELAVEEIPVSESTPEDYARTIQRHQGRLSEETIRRIIYELAEWEPPKPRKQLHRTLNAWLAKEPDAPPARDGPVGLPKFSAADVPEFWGRR